MTELEQPIYRFSEAPIWEWQRSYYEEQGIKAWQKDEVPQYISSNPIIAVAYAEMIFGFLQDRARLGYTTETVTIVELGAGSGRLAFHVLMELCELKGIANIMLPPFRYIMTDLASDTITYWRQHRSLIPFVEQGVLDFAQFDAVTGKELKLVQSGDVIQPGDLQQPLLVVANYFFDSIPQELLYIEDRKIFECRVSLELPDAAVEQSATDRMEKVALAYHYHRAAEYEHKSFPYHEVIELYKQKLDDSHILFPTVGIACLERLGQLSQQGFLLLTADKGDHRLENWEYAEPPKLIVHSSFSLTANYHAILTFFELRGAKSFFTKHSHDNLNIGCVLMLEEPLSYTHTRLAYRRNIERFGPDDFFSMKQWFDGQLEQMGIRQILAIWRLGGHDVEWIRQSGKRIAALISTCNEEELADIRSGILSMWRTYYSMGEKTNIARDCGLLLYQMEYYQDAFDFLERSLSQGDREGEVKAEVVGKVGKVEGNTEVDVHYFMAICCYEISQDDAALEFTRRTLAMEPEHEGALALRALLEEGS